MRRHRPTCLDCKETAVGSENMFFLLIDSFATTTHSPSIHMVSCQLTSPRASFPHNLHYPPPQPLHTSDPTTYFNSHFKRKHWFEFQIKFILNISAAGCLSYSAKSQRLVSMYIYSLVSQDICYRSYISLWMSFYAHGLHRLVKELAINLSMALTLHFSYIRPTFFQPIAY
jgi:hypothetical protein